MGVVEDVVGFGLFVVCCELSVIGYELMGDFSIEII